MDLLKWDGTPYFQGPRNGRRAYVVKDKTTFVAYLTLDDTHMLGQVKGSLSLLGLFEAEMHVEGARVSHGSPPFDTNTGGDKPVSYDTKSGQKTSQAGKIDVTGDQVPMPVRDPAQSPLARMAHEVKKRLLQYFEVGAYATLERLDDPDSATTPLFIVVHTTLAPTDALAALEKFDQEWWLDQANVTAGLLEVSIVYNVER